jgi:hypothetical protein
MAFTMISSTSASFALISDGYSTSAALDCSSQITGGTVTGIYGVRANGAEVASSTLSGSIVTVTFASAVPAGQVINVTIALILQLPE